MQDDLIIIEESLEDIYIKYYQNTQNSHLDKDEFDDIIRIDPTFEAKKDALGKYGKWLLQVRNSSNKSFDEHTARELNDQLNIFNKDKNGYDLADRDIGKIKSLAELVELNHKYDAKNASVQSLKAANVNGVEILGQSSNWEVYRPTTYVASKYLRGDNAVWCTGRADTASYFNSYSKSDILIIFINKKNRDEKYQGAFDKTTYKCSQFNDAKNVGVDLVKFYINNPDIGDIIKKSAYKEIDTAMQEAITKEKLINEFLDKFFAKIVDGTLVIDNDVLSMINDDMFKKKHISTDDFDAHNLKIVKIAVSTDNVSVIINTLFYNYETQAVNFLKNLEVYLPEDISDISNDVETLIKFKHIGISKKARFKCYEWQKAILRPRILWY